MAYACNARLRRRHTGKWGLRDYGTAQWDGGAEDCDHVGKDSRTVSGGQGKQYTNAGSNRVFSGDCECGARRVDKQLGLEPTIAEYVANMVEVFRLVRDVLADDGTLWLNLGDSYAVGGMSNPSATSTLGGGKDRGASGYSISRDIPCGLKPKDLCGIPWRVAFALQADGWYLRSDIIWHKPNPMPESVTDRPTKAHEYLFLLTKQERYYYDAAAIKEPANGNAHARGDNKNPKRMAGPNPRNIASEMTEDRNRRSVWSITTEPYADAHFAVMPTALVEPCILAGSRIGDTVLDPFMGSGTVAQVAQDLGRKWIGCELNPEYAKMIEQRTAQSAFILAAEG